MTISLESLVQEIVEATPLRGTLKRELKSELWSHVVEQERELQLHGCSEERIFEIISEQFNKDRMTEEFKQVYNQNLNWKWKCLTVISTLMTVSVIIAIFKPYVSGEFAPSLLFKIFGWLGITLFLGTTGGLLIPFNLLFNSILLLVGYSWPKLLRSLTLFSQEKAVSMRNYIMGSSLVFHWMALILSFTELDSDRITQPIGKAGFPVRVFLYPPTIIAEQTSELQFMPRFLVQYVFWFIISIGVYILLPKSLKENKKLASIIFMCGFAVTWFGGGYVLTHFID